MKNPENLWHDLVYRFAEQSRCKSRKVGAVIVKDGHLVAEGWNSAPQGCTTQECPRLKCNIEVTKDSLETTKFDFSIKLPASGANLDQAICVHAEANAIANCAKRGVSTEGAVIYCTTLPCAECSKLLVSAGITQVVFDVDYPSEITMQILLNGKVSVRKFFATEDFACKCHSQYPCPGIILPLNGEMQLA